MHEAGSPWLRLCSHRCNTLRLDPRPRGDRAAGNTLQRGDHRDDDKRNDQTVFDCSCARLVVDQFSDENRQHQGAPHILRSDIRIIRAYLLRKG